MAHLYYTPTASSFTGRNYAETAASADESGLFSAYTSTLLLTLTNPLTILSFMAIFAGVGLSNPKGDYLSAAILVFGVFVGSAIWWFILSYGVSMLRLKFNSQGMQWVNRISGTVVMLFGVTALMSIIGAYYNFT